MIGLRKSVDEMFDALVVPTIEDVGFARPVRRLFLCDAHHDADRWLAANDDERMQMEPALHEKLQRFIIEAARHFIPRPKRKRVRDKESERMRLRAYRQRVKIPSRWGSLTEEQRERQRGYVRACRARNG